MPVLQHFYTSFFNPNTSEGGFRTKALSPGLGPEALSAVLRLISYRIPPTLDERAPDTHPIALRYSELGTADCVISHVRSCGADENGRPGNFFAHSLIVPRQELDDVHPAYLWEHENWRSADVSAVDTIPVVPRFEWRRSVDDAAAWGFVREGTRVELFTRLLTVVASSGKHGGRRVVIVDTPDHVALWVAAICSALPSSLRPLLTFTTYYHDPYQSAWLITGTTRDSTMRFAAQDFLQYFVIDMETGRASEQEPGRYAEFVVAHFGVPGSPDELAAFLAFCDRRVRPTPTFDGRLDRLAAAYELLGRTSWDTATDSELELLGTVADDTAAAAGQDQNHEQLSDLVFTLSVMRAALMTRASTNLLESYCRAASVARRNDPVFENYLDEELSLVAMKALSSTEDARILLNDLVSAYGERAVSAVLAGPPVVERIASIAGDDVHHLAVEWDCFGRLLFPQDARHGLLEATLRSIDTAAAADQTIHPDADHLITTLLKAAGGCEGRLLETALRRRRERGGASAEILYYNIVRDLPLDRRHEWRAIVEKDVDDITRYEIECDVRRAGENAASELTRWAQHLGADRRRRQVITAGVRRAWDDAPANIQQNLARALLGQEELMTSLDPHWETVLVQSALANRSLDWAISESADFLRRFANHPALPPGDAAVLEMRMAIDSRRFDERKRAQVQERLAQLPSSSQYAKEVEKLLPPFVSPQVSITDYSAAMRAAYVPKHGTVFWRIHRDAIATFCANLPTISKVRLPFMGRRPEEVDRALDEFASWLATWFAFWFDSSTNGLLEYPYLAQQFFMELPATLDALRKCAQWKHVAQLVTDRSRNERWYPMVDRWLV